MKNFRSFRDEQRISFIAQPRDQSLPEATVEPDLVQTARRKLRLLKSVVIYGANAAGKTNMLLALGYLRWMVTDSATDLDEGDPTGIEPFLLDTKSRSEPSEFFLRFIVQGVRYHFSLVLDSKRVLFESLSAFPKGREQVWYERSWDEDTSSYHWEPNRPTVYRRRADRIKLTRENALYIANAVKFADKQLKPIYMWFKERFPKVLLSPKDARSRTEAITCRQMIENPKSQAKIVGLLRQADLGITSAKASEVRITRSELPDELSDEQAERIVSQRHFKVRLTHRGADGQDYELDWKYQSSGTRRVFALAGPLLDTLENGAVIAVDEIETSIHPRMVKEFFNLIHSHTTNPNGAQLICTSHDPFLLDSGALRRDQVWFADKTNEGCTNLYPLTDFKPRNNELLSRGYMSGRYGGIPFIPSGLIENE